LFVPGGQAMSTWFPLRVPVLKVIDRRLGWRVNYLKNNFDFPVKIGNIQPHRRGLLAQISFDMDLSVRMQKYQILYIF
jgi:hypothetical protein